MTSQPAALGSRALARQRNRRRRLDRAQRVDAATGSSYLATTSFAICVGGLLAALAVACGGRVVIDDRRPVTCAAAASDVEDPPSCKGLAPTCGPSSDAPCCASPCVPGGAFNRSNDPSYPATVSDFRLDVYEITVGRFRQFVAEYPANLPAEGAGKNPNDPSDRGWDVAWNAKLPADAAALASAVKCDATHGTWTDSPGANDNLPMNCISWYPAFAFCIWDGGRLPTEAEWNYAAAGGSEQRQYPWSNPPTSLTIDVSYAVYCGGACKGCGNACAAIEAVGSRSPRGDGRWGHADLVGNVWEWNVDWYATPYPQSSCTDCANHSKAVGRVLRGAGFSAVYTSGMLTSDRLYADGDSGQGGPVAGARCARAP